MKKPVPLAFLFSGVVLMIIGINAPDFPGFEWARFIASAGAAGENALGMLIVGSITAIAGLIMTLRPGNEAGTVSSPLTKGCQADAAAKGAPAQVKTERRRRRPHCWWAGAMVRNNTRQQGLK